MNLQKLQEPAFVFILLLTACTPTSVTLPPPQPTTTPRPTITPMPTATKTNYLQPPFQTVDNFRNIIEASNPKLPQYDTSSAAFAEFPVAVKQLSTMGSSAVDAASDLAFSITFPRKDSYLAAQTLIDLGPDISGTTLPVLIGNPHDPKPDTRLYSVFVLGSIGNQALCAVGDLAPLLWDPDPHVRSATALALDRITVQHLVSSEYQVLFNSSISASSIIANTPSGKIVGVERYWWIEHGSKIKWHPGYDLCDP